MANVAISAQYSSLWDGEWAHKSEAYSWVLAIDCPVLSDLSRVHFSGAEIIILKKDLLATSIIEIPTHHHSFLSILKVSF